MEVRIDLVRPASDKADGPNGQLPNLDFINTVHLVAKYQTGIDIVLNNDPLNDCQRSTVGQGVVFDDYFEAIKSRLLPKKLAEILFTPKIQKLVHDYADGLYSLYSHLKWGHTGAPQGAHVIFLSYGVSALTIRGLTNSENSGYWSFLEVGRVLEGTLRSLNNLLERFHQSYFLYILIGIDK